MKTTVNGSPVFYSNGNGRYEPDQPAVVFLHGAGMDHTVWVMPARYFARQGYNVVALDLPGHGRSGGAPLATVEALSDWLNEVLLELSIDSTAVVGHSMGSLIALCFTASYPGRCRALALLGTASPMAVTEQLLAAARSNDHDAIDMANTWSHSTLGLQGGNENPGICMTMAGQRLLERSADDVFFADLNACNNFSQGESMAKQIDVPTLVIAGQDDKMTAAAMAGIVADNITGSRMVSLSPCGHSMLSEQPNAVLDALIQIV